LETNVPIVLRSESVPGSLIAGLADRDVSIGVRSAGDGAAEVEALAAVLRLPWKQVLVEEADPRLVAALEKPDGGSLS
jgi:hypothetical protein